MPEKDKSSVIKSKSTQEISAEHSESSAVLERQVENNCGDCCDKSDTLENRAKTLPTGTKSNGIHLLGKTNHLKRSIVIPKLGFSSNKKGRQLGGSGPDLVNGAGSGHNTQADTNLSDTESEPAKSIKKMVKADSVKSFFAKVVNQISVNSRSRAKDLAQTEERTREWRHYFENRSVVPGVMGIRNHGNTCFINSILQCLSYTEILAEYFVLDQYKNDLRRRKRLSAFSRAHSAGRGELTEQFATLIKSLWSLQYDPEISDRFKSLVDKYGSQYKVSPHWSTSMSRTVSSPPAVLCHKEPARAAPY